MMMINETVANIVAIPCSEFGFAWLFGHGGDA